MKHRQYPVPYHPTWEIQDSTKLQQAMDCLRSYFYRYVLGWERAEANIHLEFGSAWHLAQEHLLLKGYSELSVAEAWDKLNTYYRKFFDPEMDEVYAPKNPANALKALAQYTNKYADDRHEVLYTEIAGTVPIEVNKVLHFKMDSILKTEAEGILSREHKTGSQLSRMWLDQWPLSLQTGTYGHVLHCLFPPQEIYGVQVNGAIFNKTKTQFERVPVRRNVEQLQTWYWTCLHWYEMIEWEFERLSKCKESDPVMMAFPMNTQSCTKYFGCAYHPFCLAWNNPLGRCDEPPPGFMYKWWNPAEEPAKARFDFGRKETLLLVFGC